MSTHRNELLTLQAKAERAGRTVLFNVDADGYIDSVFYKDPQAGAMALSRTGITLSPIVFAEIEREKSAAVVKAADRHRYVSNTKTDCRYMPKGYTAGTTYPLGDTPSREETGETDFNKRVAIDLMGGSRCFRVIPTGQKRAPRKGEWYLSGATVTAYKAVGDGMQSEYMIAKLVRAERVPAQETYRVIG